MESSLIYKKEILIHTIQGVLLKFYVRMSLGFHVSMYFVL